MLYKCCCSLIYNQRIVIQFKAIDPLQTDYRVPLMSSQTHSSVQTRINLYDIDKRRKKLTNKTQKIITFDHVILDESKFQNKAFCEKLNNYYIKVGRIRSTTNRNHPPPTLSAPLTAPLKTTEHL